MSHPQPVPIPNPERKYFETWLRRTGRQLAVSGRLSQVAHILSLESEHTEAHWRTRLRTILDGEELPSIELLTRIDHLLANPRKGSGETESQPNLFE